MSGEFAGAVALPGQDIPSMSVYSRVNAEGLTIWRFDFQFAGDRYLSEEPHFPTRAKAEKGEQQKRKALQRSGAVRKQTSRPSAPSNAVNVSGANKADGIITLGQACDRFWRDVGQHHRSASDIARRIEIVKRIVGAEEKVRQGGIAAIRLSHVITAVNARRAEQTLTRYGKPSGRQVSTSCANRDIIDQLRPVLNHASVVWEDDGLVIRAIKWKTARLKEADEQVCEFSDDEIQRWGEEINRAAARHGRDGANERAFLAVALEYGPRLGELHFPPEAFRPDAPDGPELELGRYIGKGGRARTSRKDGSVHEIPLRQETVELLQPLVDQARAIGAATIWLERDADGDLVPISYDAMRYRLLSAAVRAGIAKARIIHGMRHHAGSAINRIGGLSRVQQLLGHRQITTSRRYAHTKRSELRDDLERGSARKSIEKSRPSPAQAR